MLVRRVGDDRAPTVWVVPGFGDSGAAWLPLAHAAAGQRWALPDLPGFGASPRLQRTTIAALADVLAARVRAETDPVRLIGHSLGAVIAVAVAERVPDRVAALVSIEGNLTSEDAYFSGTAADYDTPAAFHTAFLDRIWDLGRENRAARAYHAALVDADERALWELGREARGLRDPGAAYRRLTCPTLYWWAPRSTGPAAARYIEEHDLPSLRVEDGTHAPHADRPEALAAELADVLR